MTWLLAFGMSHTSLQSLSLTTGFTQEGVLLSNPSWNIDIKKKKSALSSFWCSDCYCCLTINNGATSICCIQKQPQKQILPNSRACVCASNLRNFLKSLCNWHSMSVNNILILTVAPNIWVVGCALVAIAISKKVNGDGWLVGWMVGYVWIAKSATTFLT